MVSKKSNRGRRLRRSRNSKNRKSRKNLKRNSRRNSKKNSRKSNRRRNSRKNQRRNSKRRSQRGGMAPLDMNDVYSKFPGTTFPEQTVGDSKFVCNYSGVYGGGQKNKRRYSAKAGGLLGKIGSGLKELMSPHASLNSVVSDLTKGNDSLTSNTRNMKFKSQEI